MTTSPAFTNYIHLGYMDGLHGRGPDSELEETEDYQDGYLAGAHDRERTLWADPGWTPPKFLGPVGKEALPFKKGDKVRIPRTTLIHTTYHGERRAGRTYSVTLHDVYDGVPAHRSHCNFKDIVRPEPPKALWAGTGGYWSRADVNDLPTPAGD